jgi:methylmalonyl-CoA mutase C-terminal domain/subunit
MKAVSDRPKKIRALFAILSTDVHTRASIIIANEMRNAGMEVIYLGFRQTPKMVAMAAEAEAADVICISSHEGFHVQLLPKLVEELNKIDLDIPIVAGGNIQDSEKPLLEKIGVTGNFGPGTPMNEIINHIKTVSKKAA